VGEEKERDKKWSGCCKISGAGSTGISFLLAQVIFVTFYEVRFVIAQRNSFVKK